jgi:hypothetical protein
LYNCLAAYQSCAVSLVHARIDDLSRPYVCIS